MRHTVLPLIKHISSTISHSTHSSPRVGDGMRADFSTPKSAFSTQSPSDSLYSGRDPYEPSSTRTTPLRPKINLKRRTQISPNETCCFCLEPVIICFDGEEFLELTCGHFIHFDCMVELHESEKEQLFPSSKDNLFDADLESSFSVICPICAKKAFCAHGELEDKLLKTKLLNSAKAWISTDLQSETATPTSAPELPETQFTMSDSSFTPLKTPESQIGDRFWDNMKEQVVTAPQKSSDSSQEPLSATMPLFAEKSSLCLPSPSTVDTSSSLSNPKLVKVSLNPEETCISLDDMSADGHNEYLLSAVINIKTAAFEPLPINQPKTEKIITDVNKSKILNSLLDVLKSRLSENDQQKLDVANFGPLVLFDYMNSISYTGVSYHWPLIMLFEFALIVLNSEASEVILAQKLGEGDIISSVYTNHKNDTILINMTTLQLPEIRLETDGKVMLQKWSNVLKHFVNNDQCEIPNRADATVIGAKFHGNGPSDHVPCVLMTTNAWSLISDRDDSIPDEIQKINKLESNGLELPFEYINKRLPKPERASLKLILVLPMVKSKESELTDGQYASKIRQVIKCVFDKLEDGDSVGLVFVGQKALQDSNLGHYYGLVGKSWPGWKDILSSITAESVSQHEEGNSQWTEGLKYVNTLLKVGFEQEDKTIRHLIFVTTQAIDDSCFSIPAFMENEHNIQNPFCETSQPNKTSVSIDMAINQICSKYHASFSSILMADEFRYTLSQYMTNHQVLNGTKADMKYNNFLREFLVLDLADLEATVESILGHLNNATVKNLDISLATPSGIELREFEFDGEMVKSESSDSLRIHIINLESGYNVSLMFKVAIQLDRLDHKILEKGGKVSVAVAKSSMLALQSTAEVCTISPLDIRIMPVGKNIDATQLNLTIRNSFDVRDVELPIVSGSRSVKDVCFMKRKMQFMVLDVLKKYIFGASKFDHAQKEAIMVHITDLVSKLDNLEISCNHSGGSSMGIDVFKNWVNTLTELLEECKEGYSLRNYQLSNYRCFNYYLRTV
ncbi:DEBR0S2_07316g1_1 [Brettanomyces bruxellensis]|uniref:DEBR0S2_07316g1_1 n=1 Tax=Dekkera bruxellensis TaxID=5007 RepID=A0A7D9GYU8_DEKBR|nr:DEBR0S2_07316g1_1 [Brettanomyces bruxellensis]